MNSGFSRGTRIRIYPIDTCHGSESRIFNITFHYSPFALAKCNQSYTRIALNEASITDIKSLQIVDQFYFIKYPSIIFRIPVPLSISLDRFLYNTPLQQRGAGSTFFILHQSEIPFWRRFIDTRI